VLLAECRLLNGCKTGDAKITKGYRLPAKFVVHSVGPVWHGGARGEPELLASCYRRSLEVAAQNGVRTIAFPCISTGAYGYPTERAATIAVATVRRSVEELRSFTEVIFCCFSARDRGVYRSLVGVPSLPTNP
jgi:O-acetyl-ADP-ribose deacetylase (regulator of RNase III)